MMAVVIIHDGVAMQDGCLLRMRTSTAVDGFTGGQVVKSLGSRVLVLAGSWCVFVGTMAGASETETETLRAVLCNLQSVAGWSEEQQGKMPDNAGLKFLWSNALASSKCSRLDLIVSSSA